VTAVARQRRTVSDAIADASRALVATTIALGEIPEVAADVRPDDLALPAHATVLELALALKERGQAVTPDALAVLAAQRQVTTRLPDGGRAGWAEELAAKYAVVPQRIPQIVDQVQSESARRHMARFGVEVTSRAQSGHPALEIAADMARTVDAVRAQLEGPRDSCISLATVAPERVTWLWTGRLAVGKVTVLDGLPGAGKSTVTCDLAARVSRGLRFPGDSFARPAGGVIFLAAEDGLGDTMVPRLLAAGADLGQCHVWRADALPLLPDDVGEIEDAITKYGARLLILDPVTALFARDLSANSDADVRRALTPLAAAAERHGVCVVLLRHLNKRAGGSALDRGGGSIGISALARSVLLLGRDESDPETRVLASVKCNLTRQPRSLRARIVDTDGVGRIEWLAECDTTADELVAEPSAKHASKRDNAADIIRECLADGEWHRQREVMASLEASDIGEKTWKRAKSRLGIESRQRADGWWWRLVQGAPSERVAQWPGDPLPNGGPERESNINILYKGEGHGATGPHTPPPGPVTERGPLIEGEEVV
jgi:hypothetical protein